MTGMEVLITDIEGSRCPIEPQVERKSNVDKGMKARQTYIVHVDI